ncbi:MAG TPA: hypothetical protein VE081_03985, partial [Sporichthyaceae bacterium]|nr:hypothetical protein [Sporichthyaceae bacterium]
APRGLPDVTGPWQRREATIWLTGVGLGPIGLLIGWIGCRNTSHWGDQQGWLAVAIMALVISTASIAGWFRVGLTNVRRLQHALAGVARTHLTATASAVHAERAEPDAWPLVMVDGLTLYHRPDCLLVTGKSVRPTDGATVVLDKCRMCAP